MASLTDQDSKVLERVRSSLRPKETPGGWFEEGIVAQSVKDVVQSLVDDNLVDTDKIGTSVYFWAFPSKATAHRQAKLAQVRAQAQELERSIQRQSQLVERDSQGREDTPKRQALLEKWQGLKTRQAELQQAIGKYRDCDPETLKLMTAEIKQSYEATNRWTDNIYSLQSWIGRKFPSISVNDLNKQFGVPEELDYVANS
ncbi:meiotic nuclear division protein 1 homolog isoform X1 [Tigriopus californicus]|uniref:meiotic nuclear division protein 1 homolog isoform X1 n=1 Tax=Tigriopus californicus TaxID=6832 RepID=UPI0027DA5DDB|nr:meiotic nuclear division protein 1 homolog isoform X1 [Tigriopus californicus]